MSQNWVILFQGAQLVPRNSSLTELIFFLYYVVGNAVEDGEFQH